MQYKTITPEDFDFEAHKQADKLARDCDLYVLSYFGLHTVVLEQNNVIAALWIGTSGNDYEFVICVQDQHRRQGICSKLSKTAIQEYKEAYEEAGMHMRLEVVNKHLVDMLIREGFVVKEELHDRTIMVQPKED